MRGAVGLCAREGIHPARHDAPAFLNATPVYKQTQGRMKHGIIVERSVLTTSGCGLLRFLANF